LVAFKRARDFDACNSRNHSADSVSDKVAVVAELAKREGPEELVNDDSLWLANHLFQKAVLDLRPDTDFGVEPRLIFWGEDSFPELDRRDLADLRREPA
jgi:hypothetical protein